MAQIIYRDNPYWDAISSAGSAAQIDRLNKSIRDYNERKKRQMQTGVIAGGALGALGGLVLAPALGAAGAAGSAGLAGISPAVEAGLVGPTFAATSGALGSGGVLSGLGALSAGLTGASIGGQFGGQLAGEDYAGAIGTAANATAGIVEGIEDQKVYGFQPTKEDKAALHGLAMKYGTTLGDWENLAWRGGGTVAQQASLSQGAASDREIGEQYYQTLARQAAMDDATGLRLGAEQSLDDIPGYEFVPDDAAIQRTQVGPGSLESIDADAIAYRNSGGTAGAPYSEMRGSLESIGQQIRRGGRGRRQQQTPPNTSINPDGTTTQVPWGKPYYEDLTTLMVPRRDARGQVNYFPKTIDPIATIGKLPEDQQPAAIKRYKRLYGAEPGEEDQYKLKPGGGIEEKKSQEAEDRRKLINELVTTAAKNGETLDAATLATSVEAVAGVDQVLADRKQLSQSVVGFAESMQNQSIPMQASDAINAKIVEVFGGDPKTWPLNVRTAATAIAEKAKMDTAAAGLAIAEQAAANAPPPGSAASAESAGRGAAKTVKGAAKAVATAPIAAVVGTAKAAKGVGQFGVGFAEELFGIERDDNSPQGKQARQFAVLQKQNLEAGIDEPVSVVRADGSIVQVPKNSLTPERMAQLKAAGFSIPGLEGG